MKPLVLCLAGPTASGKSATTLALAARTPVEIVAVDSATIYRQMDIGTAKPSPEERARIPHHLIDILDPSETYSVAEFVGDTEQAISDILARGHLPVLCGGTMMYFKALRDGLADLPQADPQTRERIEQQASELGWPAMHQELMRVDPATASRLAPLDSQRVQRALEIYRVSGIPMSQWLAQQQASRADAPYEYITISLEPSDRAVLHERIARRYMQMLDDGLLDEVRRLHEREDLHAGLPSIRCVGYRQLWQYLDGEVELDAAVEQAIAATRQLAKRQLTWLRSQPERIVIDSLMPDAPQQVLREAVRWWPELG